MTQIILSRYNSPLGTVVMASEEDSLAGLWFEGQRYFGEFGNSRSIVSSSSPSSAVSPSSLLSLSSLSSPSSSAPLSCKPAESVLWADSEVLSMTREWLDEYFSGRVPHFIPKLKLSVSPFRARVFESLLGIPYGQTRTYADIAKEIAAEREMRSMSSQAVGGAVGHNPISIIIPCHRVLASDGSLTGYAGGLDRKLSLLHLEGVSPR